VFVVGRHHAMRSDPLPHRVERRWIDDRRMSFGHDRPISLPIHSESVLDSKRRAIGDRARADDVRTDRAAGDTRTMDRFHDRSRLDLN